MALIIPAINYLNGVIKILMDYEETAHSTTSTLYQVAFAAAGALVGAYFGGRAGGAAGGAVGAGASVFCVDDYKPLHQCLQDMDDEKKIEISNKIRNRVGNPAIEALKQFMIQPENRQWAINAIQGKN